MTPEKMPVDYAFDDACEVAHDLEYLNDEDLVKCRLVMLERMNFVLEIMGEYTTDFEFI